MVKKKSSERNVLEHITMFFLLANSGFPFFYKNLEWIYIGVFFTSIVIVLKGKNISRDIFPVLILMLFIQIGQFISFGSIHILAVMGIFLRIIYAYLSFVILGGKFIKIFKQQIYLLSIISLVFYVTYLVFPNGIQLIELWAENNIQPIFAIGGAYSVNSNIIVFCFNAIISYRNSGPFWEPGAFAGYLNFWVLLHLLENNSQKDNKFILIVVTILTTLSSMGYVALFFIIISYNILLVKTQKRHGIFRYLIITGLIVGSVWAFESLSFLSEEINTSMEETRFGDRKGKKTRFASAWLDIEEFMVNPLFGHGGNLDRNRYSKFFEERYHRNNGITALLKRFGIFFFIYYFYKISKELAKISRRKKRVAIFLILTSFFIIGFSEGFFQYPFFLGLLFFKYNIRHESFNNNSYTQQNKILNTTS